MIKRTQRDLFGGALRCAGLAVVAGVTSSAMGDFDPLAPVPDFPGVWANLTAVQGYGFPNALWYVSAYDFSYSAAFPSAVNYSIAEFSGHAYAGSTLIGASMSHTSYAAGDYGEVSTLQWFTPSNATSEVRFTWDFSPGTHGVAYVYQLGLGVISPTGGEGTSGSVDLTLLAGNSYLFKCRLLFTDSACSAFANITEVPAPGAMVILGFGALATRRRRRSEQ